MKKEFTKNSLKNVSLLLACAITIILTSCGESSSGSSSEEPQGEFTYNLFTVMDEYEESKDKLDIELDNQMQSSKGDKKDFETLVEKYEKKEKEIKDKLEEGLAKAKEQLVGKSIPVKNEYPKIEVSDLKITSIDKYHISFKGKVKIKEDLETQFYSVQWLDKDGNAIGNPKSQSFPTVSMASSKVSAGENEIGVSINIRKKERLPNSNKIAQIVISESQDQK